MSRPRALYMDLAAGLLLFLALSCCVNPVGDFPLNDDWAYGLNVKRWLLDGHLSYTGWGSMNLLSHIAWGALFCKLFGFSFTVLRFSTLALSLASICGVYLLVWEVSRNRFWAGISMAALALNPLFFALSHTFMTDISFLAWSSFAGLFFVRSLKKNTGLLRPDALLGTTLSLLAVLDRQTGLALPLAFALSYVFRKHTALSLKLAAFTPLLLCTAAMFGFRAWGAAHGVFTPGAADGMQALLQSFAHLPTTLHNSLGSIFSLIAYLGLFSLPLLLLVLPPLRPENRKTVLISLFCCLLFVLLAALQLPKLKLLMPMQRNVFNFYGIGPVTLRDAYFISKDNICLIPRPYWALLTGFSFAGAALLLAAMVRAFKQHSPSSANSGVPLFLLLAMILQTAPFWPIYLFDRYILAALPFALALAACAAPGAGHFVPQKRSLLLALAVLAPLAMYAVACTRDYLTWNDRRWTALRSLTAEQHIPPEHIDGGFEFNGLYLFDPAYEPKEGKSSWWVADDRYVVAFGPIPGYTEIRRYPWRRWFPPCNQQIVILQKNNS